MADNYKFSQDYELIPPQKQKSYPISTTEWSLVKKRINSIKDSANFWQTLGSILIGTAIPTLITGLIGAFKSEKSSWICWTAFFITLISGSLAFYFGKEQRKTQNKTKEDVIDFMTTIEERFALEIYGLTILYAKYGAVDKFVDVTARLNSLIVDDKLNFVVNFDSLQEDPIPGTVKQLLVDYTKNGSRHTVSIGEGHNLVIK